MDPKQIILGNFAWSGQYDEASFSARLYDYAEWNFDAYWQLEWALYQLADARRQNPELDWPIFRIFSFCFMSIGANFDPNDVFEFENIDRDTAYELRERFQLVFEGYFSGRMPEAAESFELPNPLMQPAR